jgi:hypothetical protein
VIILTAVNELIEQDIDECDIFSRVHSRESLLDTQPEKAGLRIGDN